MYYISQRYWVWAASLCGAYKGGSIEVPQSIFRGDICLTENIAGKVFIFWTNTQKLVLLKYLERHFLIWTMFKFSFFFKNDYTSNKLSIKYIFLSKINKNIVQMLLTQWTVNKFSQRCPKISKINPTNIFSFQHQCFCSLYIYRTTAAILQIVHY